MPDYQKNQEGNLTEIIEEKTITSFEKENEGFVELN
jgi:hypothetical protein